METLEGFAEHIIYRNEENGYTVFVLDSHDREVTCTGIFHSLDPGECLRLEGRYTLHPSYGEQFQVSSFTISQPQDALSQERYLASGAIKGIGKTLAARIVQEFGADTIRILEEEPERLAAVKGISERMAVSFGIQAADKKDQRDAMLFLQGFGISMSLAVRIYNAYGDELYGIIRGNPYRLADDMTGVGFRTADEIAKKAGILPDADFRIRSGILYTLSEAALQGHTFLPEEILTRRTAQMLGVEEAQIGRHYMDLAIESRIHIVEREKEIQDRENFRETPLKQTQVFEMQADPAQIRETGAGQTEISRERAGQKQTRETQIYAESYYRMEEETARMLAALHVCAPVSEEHLDKRIRQIAADAGIEPDAAQAQAVRSAAQNGLLVLTGGPGTGKTTTINLILRYFDAEGCEILLAAPTGRAAKRMSETTGYHAKTIHRMLHPIGEIDQTKAAARGLAHQFEHDEDYPLEADVIIIDEVSMVDITLLHALLRAILPGTRLILTGDVDQLPSVGPGSVLRDIIDSKVCETVRLTHIFRQAAQSDIIVNAHKINRGEQVVLDNKSRDFFFLKRYDAEAVAGVCVKLLSQNLPKYLDVHPYEIQLLTPTRKGLLGVGHLNKVLQRYLNPPDPSRAEIETGGVCFREGDKVMQIRNNYRLEWKVFGRYGTLQEAGTGVFNGDLGILRSIDHFLHTVTVEFEEGRLVEYEKSQLEELELAYAVTVHKAQGSEYPAVVLPLLDGPRMLLNRNLLYTAVTRAQRCVVAVGDEKIFAQMIENDRQQQRFSGLKDRLCDISRV